jgi:ribonuclease HII
LAGEAMIDTAMVVAGVDEAGRGSLAGPVCAAAVVLGKIRIRGLDDSKKLTALQRDRLYDKITVRASSWSVAFADVGEIDRLNILQASLLAMRRAVETLTQPPHEALVDGNQPPPLSCRVTTVVGGDGLHPAIMAASILAKVSRDREMVALDQRYPGYGFAQNKGYGTPEHLFALGMLGPCAVHRRSFAPVAQTSLPF